MAEACGGRWRDTRSMALGFRCCGGRVARVVGVVWRHGWCACRVDQRQMIRGGADAEVGVDGAAAAAERTGCVAAHEKGPGSTGCPKNESEDCMLF